MTGLIARTSRLATYLSESRSPVSEKGLGLYFRGQRFGLSDVVDPAARQTERERISKASTTIWILWEASARSAHGLIDDWLLARPGAVLMRSDGGVDHGVLSIGIIRYGFEKTLPNPLLRPAGSWRTQYRDHPLRL